MGDSHDFTICFPISRLIEACGQHCARAREKNVKEIQIEEESFIRSEHYINSRIYSYLTAIGPRAQKNDNTK